MKDSWHLSAEDGDGHVPDMIGMHQLVRLLAASGEELSATDLAGIGSAGGAPSAADLGPVLDARAKREYRQRVIDLQSDLDKAEQMADIARAARARAELDAILDQLRAATGLGGRARRVGGSNERARVNVARNIRRAIAGIGRVSSEAGAHLATSVRTGHWCRYERDPSSNIEWQIDPHEVPTHRE